MGWSVGDLPERIWAKLSLTGVNGNPSGFWCKLEPETTVEHDPYVGYLRADLAGGFTREHMLEAFAAGENACVYHNTVEDLMATLTPSHPQPPESKYKTIGEWMVAERKDVAVLVGALEMIAIDHTSEFGKIAREALAAYRKGGQS